MSFDKPDDINAAELGQVINTHEGRASQPKQEIRPHYIDNIVLGSLALGVGQVLTTDESAMFLEPYTSIQSTTANAFKVFGLLTLISGFLKLE